MNHQALTELLAKIEAGDPPMIYGRADPCGLRHGRMYLQAAHNGSLNAAKALHDAVLAPIDPQYGYLVGPQYARIVHPSGIVCDAQSTDPARAWLIAIIKALIATTEDTTQ